MDFQAELEKMQLIIRRFDEHINKKAGKNQVEELHEKIIKDYVQLTHF